MFDNYPFPAADWNRSSRGAPVVDVVDVLIDWLPVEQTVCPVEPGVMHVVQHSYTDRHV
jgi:hypothetical protein